MTILIIPEKTNLNIINTQNDKDVCLFSLYDDKELPNYFIPVFNNNIKHYNKYIIYNNNINSPIFTSFNITKLLIKHQLVDWQNHIISNSICDKMMNVHLSDYYRLILQYDSECVYSDMDAIATKTVDYHFIQYEMYSNQQGEITNYAFHLKKKDLKNLINNFDLYYRNYCYNCPGVFSLTHYMFYNERYNDYVVHQNSPKLDLKDFKQLNSMVFKTFPFFNLYGSYKDKAVEIINLMNLNKYDYLVDRYANFFRYKCQTVNMTEFMNKISPNDYDIKKIDSFWNKKIELRRLFEY